MEVINVLDKFSKIEFQWHPYIIGELNDNFIKLAKLKDSFLWHKHDEEDEMFMVIKGKLMIDFRDGTKEISPGEMIVVPKGIEHRPWTNGDEVFVMLIEPKSTKHTGEQKTDRTVTDLEWI